MTDESFYAALLLLFSVCSVSNHWKVFIVYLIDLSSKFNFEDFDLQLFAGCWPLWTYKTRCCAAVPDLCGSWTCAWPSFLSSTNCCRASTRGEQLRGKVSVVQTRRASVQRQRVRFKTTSASLWAFSSSVTDDFVGFTITMREMSSDDASDELPGGSSGCIRDDLVFSKWI